MKKPNHDNLTAWITGHNLTVFQKADAAFEFNKLLEYIKHLESEVKKFDLADVGGNEVALCQCSEEETTGWIELKCCNTCGKPQEQ